jgi:putative hemolysin
MRKLTTLAFLGALMTLGAILMFRSSQPSAQPPGLPPIGSTAEMKTAFYGCESSDDLSRIVELVQESDALGAAHHAKSHCIDLNAGSKGTVEDSSLESMQVCLRPTGDHRCYWTRREMLADYRND